MITDMQERVARLDTMIAEDRVIRHEWTDGRERACLLAALSPEAGKAGNVAEGEDALRVSWRFGVEENRVKEIAA